MSKFFSIIILSTVIMSSALQKNSPKDNVINHKSILGSKTDSLILWKPSLKLRWDDFQGVVDSISTYEAMTFVFMNFEIKSTTKFSIIMNISCYFNKQNSWSKNKNDLKLLAHEKLHFDIAELVTRKVREEFCLHQSKDINVTNIFMQDIVNKYSIERDSLNKSYDRETNHGIIDKKQKEWEAKITKELKALDKYSKTQVIIKREKKL